MMTMPRIMICAREGGVNHTLATFCQSLYQRPQSANITATVIRAIGRRTRLLPIFPFKIIHLSLTLMLRNFLHRMFIA